MYIFTVLYYLIVLGFVALVVGIPVVTLRDTYFRKNKCEQCGHTRARVIERESTRKIESGIRRARILVCRRCGHEDPAPIGLPQTGRPYYEKIPHVSHR